MDPKLIYLVQTDTTVGFLSNDDKKLTTIKNRSNHKKILKVVDSCKTLKTFTRVPKKFRKTVRNAKKTTFIYPNQKSFRVIDIDDHHHKFIKKFRSLYSSSANLSGDKFDLQFASSICDVEVLNKNQFQEKKSSSIIKLSKIKSIKIR
jgi:tRNA A37 threonylcarbamoyladenosine synthetase subunit TsaC/SUA5/YrdC